MITHVSRSIISKIIFGAVISVSISNAAASEGLPIADTHLHYSHDSVEMTPPERVIELMRSANLKFALVSSSDDNGTQLLSELAPDLIVPGLRPYRRRGELNTWFTDDAALAYVEQLLETNKYASIGEFHLYGDDADLAIPRRIVQLAAEHNLILHAHSDADAVERLLAQDPTVKVLWAHSGFDSPEAIAAMLEKHDRLFADLAFRSDVGSSGELSEEWIQLFTQFPNRMMLGTDTYTPERMYFVPEHAAAARTWLTSLPDDLAEKVAWKNGYALIMHQWHMNRDGGSEHMHSDKHAQGDENEHNAKHSEYKHGAEQKGGMENGTKHGDLSSNACNEGGDTNAIKIHDAPLTFIETVSSINVSQPFTADITVCSALASSISVELDAQMPAHGHGMNYSPELTVVASTDKHLKVSAEGLVLHMPGTWEWVVDLTSSESKQTITHEFTLR